MSHASSCVRATKRPLQILIWEELGPGLGQFSDKASETHDAHAALSRKGQVSDSTALTSSPSVEGLVHCSEEQRVDLQALQEPLLHVSRLPQIKRT